MKRKKVTISLSWSSVLVFAVVLIVLGCAGQQASQPAFVAPTAEAAPVDEEEPMGAEEETDVVAEEEEATEAEEETDAVAEEEEATDEPEPEEAPAAQSEGGLLNTVLQRGTLICGVNGGLPGFSNLEADGSYSGLDADFCRVVAAALFGDPEAVEFRQLSAQERFPALQTGEVDVLFRNTTWTLSRDTEVGLDFGPTIFYDGQGIMVREAIGATTLEDLEGATICVQSGTTTELNLTDQFRARGITFEPTVFEEIDSTYTAYDEERCDAVTSDRSQLLARRTTLQSPDDHIILDVVLSKEPLGPAVLKNDSDWYDVVNWAVYATIQAEEFGITSETIDDFADTDNPAIKRFLGAEGELGGMLGLSDDFAVQVVKQVGNYGEIYEQNLGPDTPFNLDRGPNALWTEGGLLYAPPFR